MTGRVKTGSAAAFPKAGAGLLGRLALVAAGVVLLAGCGGPPDAVGSWNLTLPLVETSAEGEPDRAELVYRVDIETQAENGELRGTATATNGGYGCDYRIGTGSAPQSTIDPEGRFILALDGECEEDAEFYNSDFTLVGTVEGDELTGEAQRTFSPNEAQEADYIDENIVAYANDTRIYLPGEGNFSGERTSE